MSESFRLIHTDIEHFAVVRLSVEHARRDVAEDALRGWLQGAITGCHVVKVVLVVEVVHGLVGCHIDLFLVFDNALSPQ